LLLGEAAPGCNRLRCALLRRAADKDDCAEQVVIVCAGDTATGVTVAIDAGRSFH
jgi:3-oxoacyl-[acyl-carrier protein] reductase